MDFKGFGDWIEIFRGGKQTDSEGRIHDGDLLIDRAISTFNLKHHEPPVVVGHPKENAPAFGWVENLKEAVVDGAKVLYAKFRQVVPEFEDLVKNGMYKKRSASFYPDGRLRHVGFLGATPPAIKGLADIGFDEKEENFYFYEEGLSAIARMFRKLRDYLIEKEGTEKADAIIPDWDVTYIGEVANRPTETTGVEAINGNFKSQISNLKFSVAERQNKSKEGKDMTFKEKLTAFFSELIGKMPDDGPGENFKSQSSDLKFSEADIESAKKQAAEEAAKKEREKVTAEFAESQRLARQDARKKEISAWCDTQVKAGKMTPAMIKYGVPEMLSAFAEKEDVIEFGETKEKATLFDRFKGLFETVLPKVIEFREVATRDGAAAAGNATVKIEALITAKRKENKDLGYSAAFTEVQREHPDLAKEYQQEIMA